MQTTIAGNDRPTTIDLDGEAFVVDTDLQQFRPLGNPAIGIDFASRLGERLCEQAGIVCCDHCRAALHIPEPAPLGRVPCPCCRQPVRALG